MKKNVGLIAIVLGILIGICVYYFNFQAEDYPVAEKNHIIENVTTAPDAISNTSHVENPPILETAVSVIDPSIVTHRFGGRLTRKIGSDTVGGNPVQLYEVQVESSFLGRDAMGDVPAKVTVAFNNESTDDFSDSTKLMKFETHYYAELDLHRIIHGWAVFVD